ncbi:hypothetical protein ROZALSC1DRAFT_26059, partial [Rozella allomycis CSF55]
IEHQLKTSSPIVINESRRERVTVIGKLLTKLKDYGTMFNSQKESKFSGKDILKYSQPAVVHYKKFLIQADDFDENVASSYKSNLQLIKSKSIENVIEVLKQMMEEKREFNAMTFEICMARFAPFLTLEKLEELLIAMRDIFQLEPTFQLYKILINKAAKSFQKERCISYYEEMIQSGNVNSYNGRGIKLDSRKFLMLSEIAVKANMPELLEFFMSEMKREHSMFMSEDFKNLISLA